MGKIKMFRYALRCSRVIVCTVGFLALEPAVLAAEQGRPLESSRYLGRGNTYVAATDSDEATRANPATLSETNLKFQLRYLQLDLFIGENTLDTISEVSDFASSSDSSPVALLQAFSDKFGKRQSFRGQLSPLAFRVLNFEISPFVSSSSFVDMRIPTTPTVQFQSDSMMGANIALGLPIGKTLNLGLTVRPVRRTVFSGDIEFADLLDFIDSQDMQLEDVFDKREGTQIGVDLGGIWKPSKQWRFGLLVENLGYAGNYGSAEHAPRPGQQRINLGTAYRVDWQAWHWDMFADIQDAANPENLDYFRLIHLGTEFGRSYISRDNDVGVLLGLNEGYFTAGTFVDLWITRLTMSYYAVELGEYAGQRSDRRWGVTLLSSMTF